MKIKWEGYRSEMGKNWKRKAGGTEEMEQGLG
jgi:hypothetical protein